MLFQFTIYTEVFLASVTIFKDIISVPFLMYFVIVTFSSWFAWLICSRELLHKLHLHEMRTIIWYKVTEASGLGAMYYFISLLYMTKILNCNTEYSTWCVILTIIWSSGEVSISKKHSMVSFPSFSCCTFGVLSTAHWTFSAIFVLHLSSGSSSSV
jgi:hypothetical protein